MIEQMSKSDRYNFKYIKAELENSTKSPRQKLDWLRGIKADYIGEPLPMQQMLNLSMGIGFDFIRAIDAQIDLLKEDIKDTQNARLNQNFKGSEAQFSISAKKGAKTDFLRVLYALHKLQLLELPNGEFPSQKQFFQEFGKLTGQNFDNPSSLLSQAKNVKQGTDTQVFKKLIEEWEKYAE